MGFLKELFEKKLKTAGSRDFDGPGFEVGRSAQSESCGLPDDPVPSNDGICYLQTQPSAKSFSFASQRKQQLEHSERLSTAAAAQARHSPTARVKYDSIGQFSQRVELYRGSVATVFKAVCIASNLKVIIKAYYKQKMHPKHIHKLNREMQAMRALNGPYVAEFYASFEDAQCVYIIMELCEGGDLFKTMLMHGGLLDEQWVCVEVITPLLRILEKMHSLKLLHRDIKPENIFLTGLGKFRLGDFGLAIRFDEEVPFSRSGTLDYMAPEVLRNPSVPFQEGKSVDVATLAARGVKPYGPPVDVWAAGVLAYELVCGRPPFEVEDEAQTAALIMYMDEFVKAALVKSPEARPTATALLKHPWIVSNLQRTMSEQHRPSKEMLLQPLPLDAAQAYAKDFKRTMSLATGSSARGKDCSAAHRDETASLAPLPAGGVPSAACAPSLPAAFPATPTGAQRQLQHLHLGALGNRDASSLSSNSSGSTSRSSVSGAMRPSGLSIVSSSSPGSAALSSPASAAAAERLRDLQAAIGDSKRLSSLSEPGGVMPVSAARASFSSPPQLSPLSPAGFSAAAAAAASAAGGGCGSPTAASRCSLGGNAGAGGMRPGLALKVVLPPETELELCGGSDSFCYSPTTPAPKAGIKERMKFYFQRQAGGAGGF
ncbi:kinase-like domain-containing protein [Scenedesmus sp. NREL 46B-D3]|nr:kinase-like domain-containing protein [Scenedesmus sp. NREL 46B-D3]